MTFLKLIACCIKSDLQQEGLAINEQKSDCTYHGFDAEHVAVMVLGGVVLGDVGEMRQVIGVLAGAVDVPDLVLANQFLSGTRIRERGISTHID